MITIVIMFASHCSGYQTSNFPVPMCTIETNKTPLLTLMTPPPLPALIDMFIGSYFKVCLQSKGLSSVDLLDICTIFHITLAVK